eukprot:TRINITY_DN48076_c0_g1_i1.p1 TRINITY_DN48076_c0_g1~~TRINITY_DN48076_c0_g1_i1.p1  ORF type:complete len:219 (+),score=50.64 TRINITY_DN48076_c0_g1_i1:81-737(+)
MGASLVSSAMAPADCCCACTGSFSDLRAGSFVEPRTATAAPHVGLPASASYRLVPLAEVDVVGRIDLLARELFRLHDLNGNGLLEVEELVQLNEKVALLHYGKAQDRQAIKAKYRQLFRDRLDPAGRPVPLSVFRRYLDQVLVALDPDPLSQEMIMEQWVSEASAARATFHCQSFASSADASFLSKISFAGVGEPPSSRGFSSGERRPKTRSFARGGA